MILLTTLAAAILSAAVSAGAEPPATQPKIPSATLDNSLEITGESLDASQVHSRMFVDVKVNGRGPFRFLVDSGADRSVVGLGLAERLQLPRGETVIVQGMAGSTNVSTVRLESLTIGSSIIPAIIAPALPERYLGAQGLIGIDALADQRLMLDFDAKKVVVQDSRRPVAREDGEIVVTARRRKGQLILTQASIGGDRVYAVIDTGAEVTMGNLALQRRVFGRRKPPSLQQITLISVTGQTLVADYVVLPELRIGGVVLQNIPIAFADAPPFALFGLDTDPSLLLGTDLLKSFRRVSLDFRNRKVRFALRR